MRKPPIPTNLPNHIVFRKLGSYTSKIIILIKLVYLEKAADFFQGEDVTSSANQCRQKVAQFAAQQQQRLRFSRILLASVSTIICCGGVRGQLLNYVLPAILGDHRSSMCDTKIWYELIQKIPKRSSCNVEDTVSYTSREKLTSWNANLLSKHESGNQISLSYQQLSSNSLSKDEIDEVRDQWVTFVQSFML